MSHEGMIGLANESNPSFIWALKMWKKKLLHGCCDVQLAGGWWWWWCWLPQTQNRSTHIIFFDASFSYENPRCSHWKPKVKSSWRLEVMNKNIHPNPLKPRRCWWGWRVGWLFCKGETEGKWWKEMTKKMFVFGDFWAGFSFDFAQEAWKSSWPNEGWPLGWSIDQGFPTKFFIDPQRCCGRSSSTRFHGFPLFKGIFHPSIVSLDRRQATLGLSMAYPLQFETVDVCRIFVLQSACFYVCPTL